MGKLLAIGEALIDFIPGETGKQIKNTESFSPKVGGAPANVCGAFRRLGGEAGLITQLGKDPFGDKIVEEFESYGIDCSTVLRTDKANTSLAFVALQDNGDREFSFYRNPGADMLLTPEDINVAWFDNIDFLHFCSVSLGDFPMKHAHRRAIELAETEGAIISFDPNLRPALWNNEESLRQTVREFMPSAHILKISDEELEFITGCKTIEEAKPILFHGNVSLVIYTKGGAGAEAYTEHASAFSKGRAKEVIDTTGAGDGFIGAFLYQLEKDGIKGKDLMALTSDMLQKYLDFANQFCGMSVAKHGAIASYPTFKEVEKNM